MKYVSKILLLLSFLSLGFIFVPKTQKLMGEISMYLLWIILFLPIFARVFRLKYAQLLMPMRKEIGILMGVLAIVHAWALVLPYPSFIFSVDFWWQNGFISYLTFWVVALILTLPLLATSNTWAVKKLGKNWKKLHMLVYGIAIFTVLHVVVLKWTRHFEIWPVIILGLYFIGKILEWKKVDFSFKQVKKITYPKWQKWRCIPCGYIYDPLLWDEDGWILPWTEFSDIPDNWRCQNCGVTKIDFVPYDESQEEHITATIVEHTLLNATTLHLVLEIVAPFEVLPGQYMRFLMQDALGTFYRQYSVVKKDKKRYTFTIKLDEKGRGGMVLRWFKEGDKMISLGVDGNFILQNTKTPKIFIATGTWLAPIYHMLASLEGTNKRRTLYFSVATHEELFYEKELKSLENIDLHIHITREKIEGYEEGRVDIDKIEASSETEWYLCGNPKMVVESREKLTKRGFKNIYSEEFT